MPEALKAICGVGQLLPMFSPLSHPPHSFFFILFFSAAAQNRSERSRGDTFAKRRQCRRSGKRHPPPSPQTTFPTMPCQTKLTLPQVVDPTTLPRGSKTLRLRPQRPIEIEPPSPADSQLWGGRGAGGAILKLEGRTVCANPTARVSTLTSHFISRRFLMLAPCVCSCMSTHTHFLHTCVWFGPATLTVTRTVSPSPSP